MSFDASVSKESVFRYDTSGDVVVQFNVLFATRNINTRIIHEKDGRVTLASYIYVTVWYSGSNGNTCDKIDALRLLLVLLILILLNTSTSTTKTSIVETTS